MQQEHQKDTRAVMLGQAGGVKRAQRLTREARSSISSNAARARWHPLDYKLEKEKAQRIMRQVKQLLETAD